MLNKKFVYLHRCISTIHESRRVIVAIFNRHTYDGRVIACRRRLLIGQHNIKLLVWHGFIVERLCLHQVSIGVFIGKVVSVDARPDKLMNTRTRRRVSSRQNGDDGAAGKVLAEMDG
jgi:hypothetical protein